MKIASADSTAAIAAWAQHEPQFPWSLTAVHITVAFGFVIDQQLRVSFGYVA